ncbi:putative ripening-related protein 1 [Hibiscus syriacus]|uniref:Ripening-related protein 1 n=1 Tax=Hibiscus syriacus TaxID=106335 RepID=A0A6A3AXG0_HIBSY|nr:putative ripening-related protein 1 [Hibiscus syriacus]KAE8709410.1 putative ripening-related protein 1 [Hibiscus syriacus]
MNIHFASSIFLLICFQFLIIINLFIPKVDTCACHSSGSIIGKAPPPGTCNLEDSSACCVDGQVYDLYDCSPPVKRRTKANLTLQSFDYGGDKGRPAECDQKYYEDGDLVVALSTGWFDRERRCLKFINIRGNGRRVRAKVVDECVSSGGCDDAHDYEPPCGNTIVRASKAVWSALGVPDTQWNRLDIHWSDA